MVVLAAGQPGEVVLPGDEQASQPGRAEILADAGDLRLDFSARALLIDELELGIGKRQFYWSNSAIDDRADQSIERATREFLRENFSTGQRKMQSGGLLF